MARKNKQRDEHMDESWLIPYSDLLTLLLALFIVLFASSTVETKKFLEIQKAFASAFNQNQGIMEQNLPSQESVVINSETSLSPDEGLEDLKEKLDIYIRENNLSMELYTSIQNDALLITIRDYVMFDSGSANIKPKFKDTIVAISTMLAEYPTYEVVVSGHTDNQPINNHEFESNWELSSKRALNCMKILLENKVLQPYLFSHIGYGEYRPIAGNDSPEGRAKNRRVEISIKNPNQQKTTLSIVN